LIVQTSICRINQEELLKIYTILIILLISTSAWSKNIKNFDLTKRDLVLNNYSKLVFISYQSTLVELEKLNQVINQFTENPTEQNLEAAQKIWIDARREYSKTEAFRFYGGPIDAPEVGPEGLINAWPLDEAYIDYVKGNMQTGIINDVKKYPKINKEVLQSLNEKDGEANIATGFHAIEFLLWGQDFDSLKPGNRPVSDFVNAPNANRRREYLKLVTTMLLQDMQSVLELWKEDKYLQVLKAEKGNLPIQKIMLGLTTLSYDEMSGERMTVAFEKKDQENEQDCFSDNSINDLIANQEGIINVFSKTGLAELFNNPSKVKSIGNILKKNYLDLKSIKSPFDSIVANGKHPERKKIKQIINSLQKQARLLNDLGKDFGLELNVQ
jgi:putative iron-regulated protein